MAIPCQWIDSESHDINKDRLRASHLFLAANSYFNGTYRASSSGWVGIQRRGSSGIDYSAFWGRTLERGEPRKLR